MHCIVLLAAAVAKAKERKNRKEITPMEGSIYLCVFKNKCKTTSFFNIYPKKSIAKKQDAAAGNALATDGTQPRQM